MSALELNKVAWALLTHQFPELRDAQRALPIIERALSMPGVEQDRNYAAMLDTLALAKFRTGDVEAAIAMQKKAIAAAPDAEKARFRKPLKRYEAALEKERASAD